MNEKYFVGSNGCHPEKMYFTELDAFVSGHKYLDSFDETGSLVKSYKFIDCEYIDIDGVKGVFDV